MCNRAPIIAAKVFLDSIGDGSFVNKELVCDILGKPCERNSMSVYPVRDDGMILRGDGVTAWESGGKEVLDFIRDNVTELELASFDLVAYVTSVADGKTYVPYRNGERVSVVEAIEPFMDKYELNTIQQAKNCESIMKEMPVSMFSDIVREINLAGLAHYMSQPPHMSTDRFYMVDSELHLSDDILLPRYGDTADDAMQRLGKIAEQHDPYTVIVDNVWITYNNTAKYIVTVQEM